MKRFVLAGVAAVPLLVATACSTPIAGQTPSAAPSSSDPAASGKLSAPPVPVPLNAGRFEQDPCTVLSQAQATALAGFTTSRKGDGLVAPICTWSDSHNNGVAFGFVAGNGGLATVYKSQDSTSGYFKPAPDTAGYPTVFFGTHDDRNEGGCQVGVGVADDEIMTVSVLLRTSSPSYGDPCALATKAADAAVTTLKGGS